MKTRHLSLLTLLFLSCMIFSTAAQDTAQPDTCPGLLASRLVRGARGRVLPGIPNRLRPEPSTDAKILVEMSAGSTFTVLQGPHCAENIAWWQVRYGDIIGWTAEGQGDTYWLEPSLLPELEPISAANANRLQPIAMLGADFIKDVVWSPDGETLLAAGSAGLWRYDLNQPEALPYLVEGYEGFFRSVAYSPDGKFVVTGSDMGAIRLWDAATWTQAAVLQASGASIEELAFESEGQRFASGSSDGIVQVWDVDTQTLLHRLELNTTVREFAFDAQLSLVLADVQVVNLETDHSIPFLNVGSILTVAFSPDGQMAATGNLIHQGNYGSGQLNLWNAQSGERIAEIFAGSRDISSVAFGAENTLLASTGENILIWKISDLLLASTEENQVIAADTLAFKSFPGSHSFILSQDRNNVALIFNTAITLVDLDTGAEQATLNLPLILPSVDGFASAMALSPTEPLLAFGSGRNILLWNLETGIEQNVFVGHSLDVLALSFSPDGQQLVSGSGDVEGYGNPGSEENAVRLWKVNAETLYPESTNLPGYNNIVGQAAFSPDGSAVAAWAYFASTVGVWDTLTGEQRFFKSGAIEDAQVAFSPDNELLAVNHPSTEDDLKFFDVSTGEFRFALTAPEYRLLNPVFSSNDQYLATTYYPDKILVWDTDTWTEFITLEGEAPLTFSPDGKLLTFVQDHDVILWDAESKTEQFRIPDSQGVVVFTPDSKMVMVDGRTIWNTETGELLANINVITNPDADPWTYMPIPCAFSADQRVIACNGIRLWGVPQS